MTDEVALGARRQEDTRTRRVDARARRADALDGKRDFVERPRLVAGRVLDRQSRHAGLDAKPNVLGNAVGLVRVARLEIGVHRQIGCSRDFARCDASIMSRGTAHSASGSPRENAKPELVVASALKPRCARYCAVPMSHGFGMTKQPLSCSRRKGGAAASEKSERS